MANKTRNRSAKNGRFVTKKYAKRHPATTVEEKIKPPSRNSKTVKK